MDQSGHIKDLITMFSEQKKNPDADKEWVNRTISHLKSAYACSKLISKGRVIGVPAEAQSGKIQGDQTFCICPNGAIDTGCPVHGPAQ